MQRFLLLCFCAFFTCCALPVADGDNQTFVPDRDLDTVSFVREGLAYYRKNRFIESEASFRKAIYLYPKASNLKANLAAALRASQQFDEAEDILQALNAGAPKSLDFLTSLARLYVEKRDYANARRYFTEARDIALDKSDFISAARFSRSLSAIAFRIGDENGALCQSAVALSLNLDAENIARHSRLLLATHQVARAYALLETFINQSPGAQDAGVQTQLAIARFALGNFQEALELAHNVLERPELDRALQAEARLVVSLSKRHLELSNPSPVSPDVDSEALLDSVANQLNLALEATPEKSNLYWPLNLLEEVAQLQAEKLKSSS